MVVKVFELMERFEYERVGVGLVWLSLGQLREIKVDFRAVILSKCLAPRIGTQWNLTWNLSGVNCSGQQFNVIQFQVKERKKERPVG